MREAGTRVMRLMNFNVAEIIRLIIVYILRKLSRHLSASEGL